MLDSFLEKVANQNTRSAAALPLCHIRETFGAH